MKAKKIIAIYLRLSSEDKDEDKDESNSITNQRFLLHSFIRKFPLDEYEVVEYVDDGYTGKNLDRPGMQRMLQDIRDRKVAIVVVKDFSRMARDHIIMGDFIDKIFPFLQIRFISVNDTLIATIMMEEHQIWMCLFKILHRIIIVKSALSR